MSHEMIKLLACKIREEVEDACEYAKLAVRHKYEDPRGGDVFLDLSKDETNHAMKLHEQGERVIKEADEEESEELQTIWQWEHEHLIDTISRVKQLQAMYKE